MNHSLDTALMNATRSGNHTEVQALLARGADPNTSPYGNNSPLHEAALAGHHAIVKTLLASGAEPNLSENGNFTPLHRAASAGHHAIVQTLLANGADPNLREFNGQTALECAAEAGHLDTYRTLLLKVDQPDWNRLLYQFSRLGLKDEVEVALANGANPNLKRRVGGWTALGRAAENGHHTIVQTLLANGADPNISESGNVTPLHRAACAGHHAIVQTLLANGADPNLEDVNRWTALKCAAASVATQEMIQNFISSPRVPSLQSCCRSNIRARMIKDLHASGTPVKSAIESQPLTGALKSYLYQPLTL